VSGWDTRSDKRRVPRVHKRGCDKVDRPKRGLPFGLRQNATSASPLSSPIVRTIAFVVRLASIRILQSSATAWGYFRGSLAPTPPEPSTIGEWHSPQNSVNPESPSSAGSKPRTAFEHRPQQSRREP